MLPRTGGAGDVCARAANSTTSVAAPRSNPAAIQPCRISSFISPPPSATRAYQPPLSRASGVERVRKQPPTPWPPSLPFVFLCRSLAHSQDTISLAASGVRGYTRGQLWSAEAQRLQLHLWESAQPKSASQLAWERPAGALQNL